MAIQIVHVSPEKLDYLHDGGRARGTAEWEAPSGEGEIDHAGAGAGDRADWAHALNRLWVAALGGERYCDLLVRLLDDDLSPTEVADRTGVHKGTASRRIKHVKELLTGIRVRFGEAFRGVEKPWKEMLRELGKLDLQ